MPVSTIWSMLLTFASHAGSLEVVACSASFLTWTAREARDGEHAVAVGEQLGHAPGPVRHGGDRLGEFDGAGGHRRRERADAVPGDDVGNRSLVGQRSCRRDSTDEQRQLRPYRRGQRVRRVELGDTVVEQLVGFGQRSVYRRATSGRFDSMPGDCEPWPG